MIILWYMAQIQLEIMMEWKVFPVPNRIGGDVEENHLVAEAIWAWMKVLRLAEHSVAPRLSEIRKHGFFKSNEWRRPESCDARVYT